MKSESKFDQARFERDVIDLFTKAGWTSDRIVKWAASAASGYGRWLTEADAADKVLPICRAHNAKVRADNAELVKQIEAAYRRAEPKLCAAMEAAGFRMRFPTRRRR